MAMHTYEPTTNARDPVMEAIERAPFVPLTEEEAVLLAEAEAHGGPWSTTAEMMERLERLRPNGTGE
jgi:hypothetical protein